MKILIVFLLFILVLNVLGENEQDPGFGRSLTKSILKRIMRTTPQNWCKQYYSETVCDPIFRELVLDKNNSDNNLGNYSILNDCNEIECITVWFSIWHNPDSEYHIKSLVNNTLRVVMGSDTESISDFESKFDITHVVGTIFDSYTRCSLYVNNNRSVGVYFVDISYDEFVKGITGLET
jgi:hypothetical protein